MSWLTTDGSRIGQTRAELELLMAGTAFAPARARAAQARELLDRDGAVILCGLPPQPDSLVLAAAEVLGTRLSRLYPVRERRSDRDDHIQLHNDSHRVEVDVHGQTVQLRDPDEDYVLVQCVHRAVSGGASLVADGYRVVDRLRDAHPGLWEFLTTVDVDFYGAWNPHRGVPNTPQVCRHVEWTQPVAAWCEPTREPDRCGAVERTARSRVDPAPTNGTPKVSEGRASSPISTAPTWPIAWK